MPNPPTDDIAINDQTPLYNSGIIGNYLNYFESYHEDLDIDELLRCSALTRYEINDQGHFLTQAQVNRFHRCLDELLPDPHISYKVGKHALFAKSTGTMRRYGLRFVTPATIYKAIDRIYPKWSRGHLYHTAITGRNRAESRVSVQPGVREEPFQCDNRQGVLEAVGTLLTGQPARVDHPRCMHRGDDACHYLIGWQNRPSAVWKRVAAYTGVSCMAAAATTALLLPVTWWVPFVLSLGITWLATVLNGMRLEKKELLELLEAQGDSAGDLLEEVEARYQNARLIQEIGKAGADILEINAFLDTVMASMSRNLDFSRGMIALCNEESTRLHHAASFGFSESERQFLDHMDFPIDLNHSTDIFVRSMASGQPEVVYDIKDKSDAMSPNSIAVIDTLEATSLISVPLINKKQPLGLLFIDPGNSSKTHTTSDVNLLQGIASQIAIGIINARSFSHLQVSEQRYRLLAENVTDVIWVIDVETLKLNYVSPSVEKTLAYSPEEMLALSMDQYLTPESFQRAVTELGKAVEGAALETIDPRNYSVTMELEEYHKNGSVVPIEVTAGFILDKNGKPEAVLGISRDLSERKKTEKERTQIESRLQQAQKMESLGTMAGSIAHNFNNLLMVVLGNLELAKEDLSDAATVSASIQRAINASQRAADLSNMMLTYVGQLKKESLPVDLSQLVSAELKKLDESTLSHVTLDLDLADPMPLVAADADQMRQMISGFVTNAIEALQGQPGRVRISTGSMHCDAHYLSTCYLKEEMPEGIYAYVEVADTGCGMDGPTLAKVFDPFFSTKFTGRGLGLAAVMGIIRSHYGAVKVSSKKNQGSVFTALFPIQGISLKSPISEGRSDTVDTDGKTILLVDDEAMVMEIGRQFLERLGYDVLTASNGQEAVARFNQSQARIACILLDFTMPGMDGLEAMQQIRNIRPDARIIISSGYTRQQIEDRFADMGLPDGFIHKPFEMKALQRELRRVISEDDPTA